MSFSRLAFVVIGCCAAVSSRRVAAASGAGEVASSPALVYGKLPIAFEPNRGQTSNRVQWLARGPAYTLFLAGPDAVLELNAVTTATTAGERPTISGAALRMSLSGASFGKRSEAEEPLLGRSNYFSGKDPSKWQRDVPTFGKVRLQGVYPGIDLVYYGRQGQLEYDFVLAPGVDAAAIRMRFEGATAKVAANGDLELPIAGKEVRFDKPVAYQMKDGVREPVVASFVVTPQREVRFALGAYDKRRELVIDPTLIFLGTLGTGNQQSVPNGMAVDAAGEILLTGITNDLTFPTTTGALQTACQTYSSAASAANFIRCGASSASSGFVTKISADGTTLVYSTYLHGGGGAEYGEAVAVDAAGDAYVLGSTSSVDFPITADAYETFCQPIYPEIGVSNPPVYGPETSECDNHANGGGTEYTLNGPVLFVAKLNPAGSSILYGTFFGGSEATLPVSLALDSSNNVYFASYLQSGLPASALYPNSSNVPFPVTASAYQSAGVGLQVATLSKLSADGHTLLYSTLFGVADPNTAGATTEPFALAVGPNGMAYLGGMTLASEFPTTTGSIRNKCVANATGSVCVKNTGFLSAFDTTKSGTASLVYSTYIGGTEIAGSNSPMQQVLGLAADSTNDVYVTGTTSAIDFPTTAGVYQPACGHNNAGNSCGAAFLSKVNPTGTAFVWSTYLGGTSANPASAQGNAIALGADGNVFLYGMSQDGGGDFPVVNPLQGYASGNKLFLAAFSPDASQLLFSTRFGNPSTTVTSGEQPIANNGIAVDAKGDIYFAGYTGAGGGFATTPGTYSTTAASAFPRGFFGKVSPLMTASGSSPDGSVPDGSELDGSQNDASDVDGTSAHDSGADGSLGDGASESDGGGTKKPASSGCGCDVGSRKSTGAGSFLLLMAIPASLRRRRR